MNGAIIDAHVHFGAPPDEESGCYWSEEFAKTPAYYAMLLLTGSLFKRVDINRVRKKMLRTINGSQHVNRSVVLAMDQTYDENGQVHREWTHLHTPNSYIVTLARMNERILFGASVHPYRHDWSDELDYCLENRAVLCKWIPSSQMIDPSSAKCTPFYHKLADRNLPLLCHTGPEYTIPTSNPGYVEFNNPRYLRSALDHGVTVIAAHCAMPYWGLLDVDYHDDFDEFLKLFEEADKKEWKLYADLSAICSPFRIGYVEKIKEDSEHIPAKRLIFGSDYPIPLFELSYNKNKNFFSWLRFLIKVATIKNQLDKNYLLIEGMNFDRCIFSNAAKLFDAIAYRRV